MSDNVNSPAHYTGFSRGAQVIDITEHLSFALGNVVKYCARAGSKSPETLLEDLEKAQYYLEREIQRVKAQRVARVWYSYYSIPTDVDVLDKDGDAWWGGDQDLDDDPAWVNSYAPFTEVIDAHDE